MRPLIEAIEAGAHVECAVMPALIVGGGAINLRDRGRPGAGGQRLGPGECQVHGRASGVIRHPRHIPQAPEVLLVHTRVELGLAWVARFGGKAAHIGHRPIRSITIKHLQTVALRTQRRLYPGERPGSVQRQQAFGGGITVEWVTGEVVGAGVANVLLDARINRSQIDHVPGSRLGTGHARQDAAQQQQ
ncbi:hypothetical protein D3C84_465950 [compost metagenome]